MAKEFFQGDRNPVRTADERGSIRQAILLVILLLTAGLGYVYFFTGLIKPRENVFTLPPAKVAPVKQPIPPRPTLEAGGETTPATPPEGVQPLPAPTEKAAPSQMEQKGVPAPAGKPADTTTAKPATAPPVKPAATPIAMPAAAPAPKPAPKPSSTPAQKAIAAPAPRQTAAAPLKQTVKATKGEEKKAPKVETKKTAAASTTTEPAKKAQTEAVSKEASKGTKAIETTPSTTKRGYSLVIGHMASAGEAERLRVRLKKLGIDKVSVNTVRKTETMHRLSLGEFSDAGTAGAELGRLKPQAAGAFVLKEKGKYALYAGSYLHGAKAVAEAKRLEGKGFKPEIKTAKVEVQVYQVMAGSFAGNDEASNVAEKLKKNGISAEVVKLGQ